MVKAVQKSQVKEINYMGEIKTLRNELQMMRDKVKSVETKSNTPIMDKIGNIASTGWNWLKDVGAETIFSLGAALLDEQLAHTKPSWIKKRIVKDGAIMDTTNIPAGTVLKSFPINAQMFQDVNDRLQKKLSLYTYYEFVNSHIEFNSAQGDLVNGLIGMFIVPDPMLVVSSDEPVIIERLVRQFKGKVCKLSKNMSIPIPSSNRELFVEDGYAEDRRFSDQGTLYIVAMSDIGVDGPIGEFSIKYNVRMAKDANTGLSYLPECTSLVSYWKVTTSGDPLAWPTTNQTIDYWTTMTGYSTITDPRMHDGLEPIGVFGDSPFMYQHEGHWALYPGCYELSTISNEVFLYRYTTSTPYNNVPSATMICSIALNSVSGNSPTKENSGYGQVPGARFANGGSTPAQTLCTSQIHVTCENSVTIDEPHYILVSLFAGLFPPNGISGGIINSMGCNGTFGTRLKIVCHNFVPTKGKVSNPNLVAKSFSTPMIPYTPKEEDQTTPQSFRRDSMGIQQGRYV